MNYKVIYIFFLFLISFNCKADCEFDQRDHGILYEAIYFFQEAYEEREPQGFNQNSAYLLLWANDDFSFDLIIDDENFFDTASIKIEQLGDNLQAYAIVWVSENIEFYDENAKNDEIVKINFGLSGKRAFDAYFKLDGDPNFQSLIVLGCGRSLEKK